MATIIVNGGGINWCWYTWYEVDGDTAKYVKSDRWHKFDEHQGAGAHPKADYSQTSIYEALDPARRASADPWDQMAVKHRDEIGLGDGRLLCVHNETVKKYFKLEG